MSDEKPTPGNNNTETGQDGNNGDDQKPKDDGITPKETPEQGDDQKPNDKPPQDPPRDERVVPETYDLKVKKGTEEADSLIESAAKFAQANKLSNQEAQAVLERDIQIRKEIAEANQAQLEQLRTNWADETKNDKEIGGENFNESVAHAKRFIDKYGTPALKDGLNQTGIGNHPEFIRLFARAAKDNLSEDELVTGTGKAPAQKSMEATFYPSTSK